MGHMGHETWDTTGTWDMGHIGHREWEHGGHGTMYRDTGLWTWSWGIPLYFPQGTLLDNNVPPCPLVSPHVPSCVPPCPLMSPHVQQFSQAGSSQAGSVGGCSRRRSHGHACSDSYQSTHGRDISNVVFPCSMPCCKRCGGVVQERQDTHAGLQHV